MNLLPFPSTSEVHVAPLHPAVTPSMLFSVFSQYGEILQIKIKRDIITRESRGFGYISFLSQLSVSSAVACSGKEQLLGRLLLVTPRGLTKVVHLLSFPKDLTAQRLREACNIEKTPPFLSFNKVQKKTGTPRTIELKFERQEHAGKFVSVFQNYFIDGTRLVCKPKYYRSKTCEAKRKEKLAKMLRNEKSEIFLVIKGLKQLHEGKPEAINQEVLNQNGFSFQKAPPEATLPETKMTQEQSLLNGISVNQKMANEMEHGLIQEEFKRSFEQFRFKEMKFEGNSVKLSFLSLENLKEFLWSKNIGKIKQFLGGNEDLKEIIEASPGLYDTLKTWRSFQKDEEQKNQKKPPLRGQVSLVSMFEEGKSAEKPSETLLDGVHQEKKAGTSQTVDDSGGGKPEKEEDISWFIGGKEQNHKRSTGGEEAIRQGVKGEYYNGFSHKEEVTQFYNKKPEGNSWFFESQNKRTVKGKAEKEEKQPFKYPKGKNNSKSPKSKDSFNGFQKNERETEFPNADWPKCKKDSKPNPKPSEASEPFNPFPSGPTGGLPSLPSAHLLGNYDYPLGSENSESMNPKGKKSKRSKNEMRFRDFHRNQKEFDAKSKEEKERVFKEFVAKKAKKLVNEEAVPFYTQEILNEINGSVQRFLELLDNRMSQNFLETIQKIKEKRENESKSF